METSILEGMSLRRDLESVPPYADAVDALLAASGDTGAFERLYRSHSARVYSLACRLIGYAEATEVTQDVFVRAWQKLGTYRGEAAFGTWLHRLAVNLILGRRSRLKLERDRRDDSDGVLDGLAAQPAATDAGMDFEAAIRRLPEGARQIFVLHDVEGYKHDEIGTLLGISPGTSKAQLHRARMMMRRHLGR
jgi:RNA polymerase sigma-70 factor (ECF subfamily)